MGQRGWRWSWDLATAGLEHPGCGGTLGRSHRVGLRCRQVHVVQPAASVFLPKTWGSGDGEGVSDAGDLVALSWGCWSQGGTPRGIGGGLLGRRSVGGCAGAPQNPGGEFGQVTGKTKAPVGLVLLRVGSACLEVGTCSLITWKHLVNQSW